MFSKVLRKRRKVKPKKAVFESPVASEQEAVFSFYTNSENFLTWMKCFCLRHWTDLCDEFDMSEWMYETNLVFWSNYN